MYAWDALGLQRHYLQRGLSKAATTRKLGVSRGVFTTGCAPASSTGTSPPEAVARARQRTQPTKLAAYEPLLRA